MNATKTLVVISHTPSENTLRMRDAVLKGTTHPDIEKVNIKQLNPQQTQPEDIKSAQGIIIGTTENLGYMAGLIKDVFDRCYYSCLEHTQGMPFTYYVRAGHDGTGTQRALDSIATGLRWKPVQPPLICRGEFKEEFITQCEELGTSMAAGLDAGIY